MNESSPIHPINSLGFDVIVDDGGILTIRASTIETLVECQSKEALKSMLRERIECALLIANKMIDDGVK